MNAGSLLRDANGADVLVEAVLLWGTADTVSAVVDASLETEEEAQARGDSGEGEGAGAGEGTAEESDGGEEVWVPAHEHIVGHRTLRRLVDAGSYASSQGGGVTSLDGSSMTLQRDDFGVRLAQRLLQNKGLAVDWACSNRGAHVIAYLLRGLVDPAPLRKELLAKKARLTKLHKLKPEHGVGLVLDFLNGKLVAKPQSQGSVSTDAVDAETAAAKQNAVSDDDAAGDINDEDKVQPTRKAASKDAGTAKSNKAKATPKVKAKAKAKRKRK